MNSDKTKQEFIDLFQSRTDPFVWIDIRDVRTLFITLNCRTVNDNFYSLVLPFDWLNLEDHPFFHKVGDRDSVLQVTFDDIKPVIVNLYDIIHDAIDKKMATVDSCNDPDCDFCKLIKATDFSWIMKEIRDKILSV